MLKLPGNLSAEQFLRRHWQKRPLFMPQGAAPLRPTITRNELAWLATLEDVESRLVFVDRTGARTRYRAENGPFPADELSQLPRRDWTLLVHDVEKHVPALRRLFALVPFIPDWRIDDLMVSFAAPGGGVGPHRDHYDVFLCQGIGIREWRLTEAPVPDDTSASDDLALTEEFPGGERHVATSGDVLYLPPGVVHWGTAQRACMTYSIGMRAPQLSDLAAELPDSASVDPFYEDPDLAIHEAGGRISDEAVRRASNLLASAGAERDDVAMALGRFVTQTKDWMTPDIATPEEADSVLDGLDCGMSIEVHGMARMASDGTSAYVNGRCRRLPAGTAGFFQDLCTARRLRGPLPGTAGHAELVRWMLESGAFELTGNW